ncbi:K+-sensing histidine kinase KdpD [Bradyrhizobium sp. AZCC 1719]|uniref:hypothetical protein n=1 Tax=Bradyrhizobium sp. AZCC 1719 TaxID=3117028 RepID=UPI002FF373FD
MPAIHSRLSSAYFWASPWSVSPQHTLHCSRPHSLMTVAVMAVVVVAAVAMVVAVEAPPSGAIGALSEEVDTSRCFAAFGCRGMQDRVVP